MTSLPHALLEAAERSPWPEALRVAAERLAEDRPGDLESLADGDELTALGRAFVSVVAASRSLTRLLLADREALEVLDHLDRPIDIDRSDVENLARSKRLETLRIAGADLLGASELEEVGCALSRMAERVLDGAVEIAGSSGGEIAIIGMGKLGGEELNYASDVDIVFVSTGSSADELARKVLSVARRCFRVDANLRPDGRAGPLTLPVERYRRYWDERAATWEMQALIKARPVAGDTSAGARFETAASEALWGRRYGADELAEVRTMKARSEDLVSRRGVAGREIKRGPGGIRDVEFAVQLLQLVHGRNDGSIRDKSTLGALRQLRDAGYIAREDSLSMSEAYTFLRTVEHRLQLVEEEQTHSIPSDPAAHQHLARVLGFRDALSSTASADFERALVEFQQDVRAVHERLFFRPLLEAFAATEAERSPEPSRQEMSVMDESAVAERLAAFGFADVERTRSAVRELATGLTRSSRLMSQLLPLLLDWLSLTPDPDLGLVGLRNLVVLPHQCSIMVATFRESPEAARRLCIVLGSSRVLAQSVMHNPELVTDLANDGALASSSRAGLVEEAGTRIRQRDVDSQRAQLGRLRDDQVVRIAARDLLGMDDVRATAGSLSTLSEALLEAALDALAPQLPFCIVGLGRFGGAELSYASDLDVIFVFDDARSAGEAVLEDPDGRGSDDGESIAEALYRFVRGPSPALGLARLDLGLRPEGAQGRLARGLGGYATYFSRWAQTWERQAMLRARVVAGDRELGERFMALADSFVWDRGLSSEETTEIRRMKARMERERIPAREDPEFHLKLGKGSLSDVEWTVQLLQLQHGVAANSTLEALSKLVAEDVMEESDEQVLRSAYEFLERTRNRWYLVGALPGGGTPSDSLPAQPDQMSRLARSLETTPAALRDEYRRVTRRARRVTERLFYGLS